MSRCPERALAGVGTEFGRSQASLMIEWSNLTKRYSASGTPALDAVNFDVQDGEVLGLVGLNGAGKTTAIRAASGAILPTRGTVRVDGHDIVRDKIEASKRLGWIPELPNCDPDRRALPTLRYFAGFYGITGAAADSRCRELLRSVGLEETERLQLRKFSQGMFKRFNLAAAMVGDPPNVLLDEVLNGLDPLGIQFVRNWMLELRAQRRAVLLSSHQLAEVERIADRVAFIHRGKLLRVIRRSELERLLGGETRLRIRIQNHDEALLEYLRTLGSVSVSADSISLSGIGLDSAAINRELIRRGYAVAEIQIETTALEDYFLHVVEEAA